MRLPDASVHLRHALVALAIFAGACSDAESSAPDARKAPEQKTFSAPVADDAPPAEAPYGDDGDGEDDLPSAADAGPG